MPSRSIRPLAVAAMLAIAALPGAADEVTDSLDAARAAYDAGDLTRALEELTFAQSLLQAKRTEGFTAFLPPAPEGWARAVSTDASGAMALMGGGAQAEATYTSGAGSFTLTIVADSPMVMAMAPMLSNPMLATAAGAKMHRIGDRRLVEVEDRLAALVDNRILVQAEGATVDLMMPVVEAVDFEALAAFKP